jgi:hypothetical protein
MRFAPRQLVAPLAFIAFIILGAKLVETKWPDVDISLESCQPDGIWARLSRAWDPLSFWVAQHVTLDAALEHENFEELIHDCQLNRNTEAEILACAATYRARHEQMLKCAKHSAERCRSEGGRCEVTAS